MSFSFWWQRLDFVWRPKRDKDLCFLDYRLSKERYLSFMKLALEHISEYKRWAICWRERVFCPLTLSIILCRTGLHAQAFLTVLSELSAPTLLSWLVPFPLCGNACHFPYLYRVFLPRSCSDGKTTSSLWPQYIFSSDEQLSKEMPCTAQLL